MQNNTNFNSFSGQLNMRCLHCPDILYTSSVGNTFTSTNNIMCRIRWVRQSPNNGRLAMQKMQLISAASTCFPFTCFLLFEDIPGKCIKFSKSLAALSLRPKANGMHWFIARLSRRYQLLLAKDLAHLPERRFARRCMNVTAEPNGQDTE